MKYQRYKRGQIVLVDFSPSMGCELRGKHFAIVLTKNDSPNNGVLTVIPLSSKSKPYYLDVGNIVANQIYPQIIYLLKDFTIVLESLKELDSKDEQNMKTIITVLNNYKEFKKIADIYMKKNKRSYALVQNITTISKMRIKKPVNQYDPIKKLVVDSLILDLIDKKIKELFVNEI